ncbi:hypothetical protein [Aerosakkonema funiforme]|uniref:hypothetical protein n=1 Tax=Aerosakkonema funiforme TaxID=1246630 RepID=UPI0035B8E32A
MPSPAGRYRSRLFNVLSRQYRRMKDKSDRALRHLQVGATWTAQILLYPAYLTVQAVRLAGKQLKQAVSHSNSTTKNLPSADIPIQRVLETAISLSPPPDVLGEAVTTAENIDFSDKFAQEREIQAIASLLDTRNLVLVTPQNEIREILTAEDQQELHKRITFELSDYYHQQFVASTAKATLANYLPILEDRPQLFPPVRLFRQFMTWMQTGPVATLVNLFQEETLLHDLEAKTVQLKLKSQEFKLKSQELQQKIENSAVVAAKQTSENAISPETEIQSDVVATLTETPLPETEEIIVPSFIYSLDSTIAQLESGNLAVVTEVTASLAHRSQEFLQVVKTRWIDSHPTVIELENSEIDDAEAHHLKFKVQSLIKAAIDYFFGANSTVKLPSQTIPALTASEQPIENLPAIAPSVPQSKQPLFNLSKLLPRESPKSPASEILTASLQTAIISQDEDPWLTESDLFGNSGSRTPEKLTQIAGKKTPPVQETGLGEGEDMEKNNNIYMRATLISEPKTGRPKSVVKNRHSENRHSDREEGRKNTHPKSKPTENKTTKSISANTSLAASNRNTNERDRKSSVRNSESDWIEIKAKPAGYVKHPLEQILEWLDLAMLWLEELIVKGFQLAHKLFTSKK